MSIMVLYSNRKLDEINEHKDVITLNNIKKQLDYGISKKNLFLYVRNSSKIYYNEDNSTYRNICGYLNNYSILSDKTIVYEFLILESPWVMSVFQLNKLGIINTVYMHYNLDPIDCSPNLLYFFVCGDEINNDNILNITLNKLEYQELKK